MKSRILFLKLVPTPNHPIILFILQMYKFREKSNSS